MRRAGFGVAVIVAILALSSRAGAEGPTPDATLRLTQHSFSVVVGYTWGTGALTYAKKSYPVEVGAFSVLALGIARAEATGEVFNLKKLAPMGEGQLAAFQT